jgi:predicted nucleic acid-binding protein
LKICCDTTFLIDLAKGRRKAISAYQELKGRGPILRTTFLNVGELLAGIGHVPGTRKQNDIEDTWSIIEGFVVLGVERPLARKVAEVYAALHRRLSSTGTDIPASDKIIIAIALGHEISTFLTRDVDHFGRVPGIDVLRY